MFITVGRLKKHTGIEIGGEKVVTPIEDGETNIITKVAAQNNGEALWLVVIVAVSKDIHLISPGLRDNPMYFSRCLKYFLVLKPFTLQNYLRLG